jgi:hypothetical protein
MLHFLYTQRTTACTFVAIFAGYGLRSLYQGHLVAGIALLAIALLGLALTLRAMYTINGTLINRETLALIIIIACVTIVFIVIINLFSIIWP